MKLIMRLSILIALALLVSCNNPLFNTVSDLRYQYHFVEGHDLYHLEEFDRLNTHAKIGYWIWKHVKYDDDQVNKGDWIKNPEQTLADGRGICGDFAILYLNIAHYGMGLDGELCLVDGETERAVEEGGLINHAVVRFGDVLVEPQSGLKITAKVGYSYAFSDIF